MKIPLIAAGLLAALIAAGVLVLREEPAGELPPAVMANIPAATARPESPEPDPQLVRLQTPPAPEAEAAPEPEPQPKPQLVQKEDQQIQPPRPDYARYWKQQERQFNNLVDRLANETDPRRRQSLINAIARHIRVDTLATLDWVSTLETAEEQRAALEAINRNALVGIGARIEVDSTGLPLIRETTIMSAVEATGMVAAGDYISGMVQPDGTTVHFDGMPVQQIVRHLRGQVGTEPTLMMKRYNDDGSTITFDVAVPRSLLVVGPPNSFN